jgi:flavodoxin/membrane protease YdiL (CAAX protease family)
MTQETTTLERGREDREHVKLRDHSVTIYFILVFAIAWAGAFVVIGPKLMRGEAISFADLVLIAIPMFLTPTLVGIAMTALVYGKAGLRELFSRMRKWRVGARWYASVAIFPIMILVCLLPLSRLISSDFTPSIFLPGIVIGILAGYFEEIGWTGFAFPRLAPKYGMLGGAFIIGLLQTIWHVAADFMGGYGARGALWLPHFILFMISMMAMRVLLVWVYVNTGSVLAAQFMHASSTGFLSILVPLSLSPAQDTLFYGVYSVVLWAVATLVMLIYGRTLEYSARNCRPAPGPNGYSEGKLFREREDRMGECMKVLVVHYSRTGNTEKVAAELAKALGADTETIVDQKNRKGPIGWLTAGKDSSQKIPAHIDEPKYDPSAYEMVVIGTPVWAWTVSAPVLAYLNKFSGKFPEVAFFLTYDGNMEKTFEDMTAAAKRQPKATLAVHAKELKRGEHSEKVKEFVAKLSS